MTPITYAHALLAVRIIIAAIVFGVFCALGLLVPELVSQWRLWRERRAVAARVTHICARDHEVEARLKAEVEEELQARRQADMRKWGFANVVPNRFTASPGRFSPGRERWDTPGVNR